MTYDETMIRLEEMRPRFDAGFSTSDRVILEELHKQIFSKPITLTGCADCYRDAFITIYNYLKRSGKMPEQTNYSLLRGYVLHEFGDSEYYTNDISDDVAENFLLKDNSNIKYFERFPEDWLERITRRNASNEVNALPVDDGTSDDKSPVTSKKKARIRK